MSELVEKLFAIHDALTEAGLAHAFGGGIALAYCAEEPRITRNLVVNVFVDAPKAESVLTSMPVGIRTGKEDIAKVKRDGEVRLHWGGTPITIFLNSMPFHDAVASSVVWVPFVGREIPVLGCAALVVFKALLGRTKDWADIEEIAIATPEDIEDAAATIADLVGEDDPAVEKLGALLKR
jgi:hypothetical protein